MTYELINDAGNTVASFDNWDDAWAAMLLANQDCQIIMFDDEGVARGGMSFARFE